MSSLAAIALAAMAELQARDGLIVNEVDDVLDGVGVRFGQNAVAEVEDVAAVAAAMDHVFDARSE